MRSYRDINGHIIPTEIIARDNLNSGHVTRSAGQLDFMKSFPSSIVYLEELNIGDTIYDRDGKKIITDLPYQDGQCQIYGNPFWYIRYTQSGSSEVKCSRFLSGYHFFSEEDCIRHKKYLGPES